mgnify:CR=1 FL=1
MLKIRRAILSCHDKTGLVEFAQFLRSFDVELLSTAGTLDELRNNGIEAMSIADFIGVPEMLDGRVKTLHPKIHAGLLGVRDSKLHNEQLEAHDYKWVDLVVINLHPVESVMKQPGIMLDEVVEQIDIGGSAMLRSAAKNFRYVTAIVQPDDYAAVMHDMRALDGSVSYKTRFRLAQDAFAATAAYDQAIVAYLQSLPTPEE